MSTFEHYDLISRLDYESKAELEEREKAGRFIKEYMPSSWFPAEHLQLFNNSKALDGVAFILWAFFPGEEEFYISCNTEYVRIGIWNPDLKWFVDTDGDPIEFMDPEVTREDIFVRLL